MCWNLERTINPEIMLDQAPSEIAVNDEGTIFVSHRDSDTVSVIDGDTLTVYTIPVGKIRKV